MNGLRHRERLVCVLEQGAVCAAAEKGLRQKCEFKGIHIPVLSGLEQHPGKLQNLWQSILAYPLPTLPSYEDFREELSAFVEWLSGGAAPVIPARYAVAANEADLRQYRRSKENWKLKAHHYSEREENVRFRRCTA